MTRLAHISPTQTTLQRNEYNLIEEKTASAGIKGFIWFGVFAVALFGGGAGYWASTSKLDGAVVAPASLVVEGNRKTVEHLDGGIVRDILVADGDIVTAGQTLLELDSTDLSVDLDVIKSQLGDLMVRRARLLMQVSGSDRFDADQASQTFRVDLPEDVWINAFATQKQLFDAERRTRSSEEDLLEQQIYSLERQIAGLAEQRNSNARQLEITREELGNLETLFERGLVAVTRVISRRVEVERLGSVDASLRTEEAQQSNRINELRLTALRQQKQRTEAGSNELAVIEGQLATLEPQYNGALARLTRISIKAPVSGRVVGLTVFTSGGVVRPGAPLLDIVPENEPLLVEARVNTADIEKLVVGQATRVRMSAFDQGDVPEATGQIIHISADSLEDERTGDAYYLTRVRFDDIQPENVASLDLVPGMPADLFVTTGERTALSYLMQPLQSRLARTFVE